MKRARRALGVVVLHIAEGVALVLVGAAIICALALWRLSQGPIRLDFMSEEFEAALARALDGDVVSIGAIEATWRREDRSVGVILTDVSVAQTGGDLIAETPELAADLRLTALFSGRVAFSRLVIEGGEMAIVRAETGAISAGLGGPDRVLARALDHPPTGPRGLVVLRDTLESQASAMRDLSELRLEGATLYVRDAITGADWRSDDATLRVTRDAQGMRAEAAGAIVSAQGGQARLRLSARAGPSLRQALFEAELRDASPAEMLPPDAQASGPLGALARLDLPVSARASAAVDQSRGLLAADLDVTLGAGEAHAFGRDVEVRTARAHFSYDPQTGSLTVDPADLDLDIFQGRLRGTVAEAADLLWGTHADVYPVTLVAEALTVDARPVFDAPLDIASVGLRGAFAPAEQRVAIDSLDVHVRNMAGSFSGEARLERASDGRLLPAVRLSGPVEGEAGVQDLLDFWPVALADGARTWIEDSVHGGAADNVHLDIDLPVEAIVAQRLDDDKLTLSFDFHDAEAAFISTMSPVTGARGHGVLHGNHFDLQLDAGEMAGLTFTSGFVDIPRLNPKGALARFGGVARGDASDMLAFIDEPPMKFPSGYGVDPKSITGPGEITVAITRPMLVDVPVEDIGYEVSGAFDDVHAPTMLPGLDVSGAHVEVDADTSGIEARATGQLGPAPADITWHETFGDGDAASTTYDVTATLDAAAFDALGASVRQVFSGDAGVHVQARGRGLDIASAEIDVDLANAELELPDASWTKPMGAPGAAHLRLDADPDGRLVFSDATITSPGADAAGAMTLAADGRLESLVLDHIRIEDLVDAHATLSRGDDGAVIVTGGGAFVDARSVFARILRGGGADLGAPLNVALDVDRVLAGDGAALSDVSLELETDGARTRRLDFSATGEAGPITAQIGPAADGPGRRLTFEAADAGEAAYIFLGLNSVRGGTMSAHADLPALDAPEDAPITAELEMRRFALASAPPLAQILTIASLEGLANTLAGEGIRFSRLDAPMRITGGRITLDEARAAGQALGVTVNGTVDLDARTFDLDGVLVPAYGVNSILGQIPVLGDIFVSRRGEGVFALTYSIDGPFEETRVFVNPLSALAPGFLRRLFEPVSGASAESGENSGDGSGDAG